MSLPKVFKTCIESIPTTVPYLKSINPFQTVYDLNLPLVDYPLVLFGPRILTINLCIKAKYASFLLMPTFIKLLQLDLYSFA